MFMFTFTKDHFRATTDRVKNSVNSKLRFSDVSIAFQPIIDASSAKVWGYEALTRGSDGRNYPAIVAGMTERKRMAFDKLVTMKALREAGRLGLTRNGAKITLNVRPTMDHAAVDAAFVARAARHFKVPLNAIVLELTEDAKLSCDDFRKVIELHRLLGISTGIDDFGSGYSGLNVLASCGAAMVKLDRQLISGIDHDESKQMIVESFTMLCTRLGSMVVAEGVETHEEAVTLRKRGIHMMQGYYFGRPTVGSPSVLRVTVEDVETPCAWAPPVQMWPQPVLMSA
jgi:EAL domain-containing protein (putative c-di-GMP-specific phosphodiesterase class I)